MDFDGDGIGDILSGSYPGELYFFKGKGKGEFAAPVKLQRDGKAINLGPSSTVFAVAAADRMASWNEHCRCPANNGRAARFREPHNRSERR